MNNTTYIWHVTVAVHEDRVHALQRCRRNRARASSPAVKRSRALGRQLARRLQVGPARVAFRTIFPS